MAEKHICIEFIGGDMDGRTLDSHSGDPNEQWILESCLDMTRNGTVGRAFHGQSLSVMESLMRGELSPTDLRRERPSGTHQYTVSERLDDGEEVLIRMRYSVRPLRSEPDEEETRE